ncbi:MAG TPA: glycosyltransferase [Candidatus Polarisedimenticolaceae bacterium]
MTVLFVIRNLEFGGAETQLVVLAEALRRRGHRIAVATLYPDGTVLGERLERAGVARVPLGKRGRLDVAGPLRRFAATLRRIRPDAVYGFLSAGNLLAASTRVLAPGCAVVWGLRASDVAFGSYGAWDELNFHATRVVAPAAHLLIANSETGARRHADAGFPGERLRVVPNGIDVDRFRPDATRRAASRAAWGIGPEETVAGIVARLDPAKDWPTFVAAASRFVGASPRRRIAALATGSARALADLRERVREAGLARSWIEVAPTAAVEHVYAGLDLLVSSSSSEGFPNVVAEAMACGVPAVVTRVGDSAALVGDPARVVPAGDAGALAAAMDAAAVPRRAPDTALRDRVVSRYSIAKLAERTEALLLEAVGR